ncbi:hypothetical protein I4U23_026181 [Adineta vaga]|nr:hypothetical protein I4U23_026181 [Adineta vaga]
MEFDFLQDLLASNFNLMELVRLEDIIDQRKSAIKKKLQDVPATSENRNIIKEFNQEKKKVSLEDSMNSNRPLYALEAQLIGCFVNYLEYVRMLAARNEHAIPSSSNDAQLENNEPVDQKTEKE